MTVVERKEVDVRWFLLGGVLVAAGLGGGVLLEGLGSEFVFDVRAAVGVGCAAVAGALAVGGPAGMVGAARALARGGTEAERGAAAQLLLVTAATTLAGAGIGVQCRLIYVMMHLDKPEQLGRSLAASQVPLLYGIPLAGLAALAGVVALRER